MTIMSEPKFKIRPVVIKKQVPAPAPVRELSPREQRYFNHPDYQKDGTLHIYTDGSTIGNGRADATGGYGVFFGRPDINYISAEVVATKVTNNIAELKAIIEALKVILTLKDNDIVIHYDSDYAAGVITGKKNAAKNLELVDEGKQLLARLNSRTGMQGISLNLKFEHVYSHTGDTSLHSIGNDIADCLAKRLDLKK
jgi:ribonuclease HI